RFSVVNPSNHVMGWALMDQPSFSFQYWGEMRLGVFRMGSASSLKLTRKPVTVLSSSTRNRSDGNGNVQMEGESVSQPEGGSSSWASSLESVPVQAASPIARIP